MGLFKDWKRIEAQVASASRGEKRKDGCSFVGLVVDAHRNGPYDYDAANCVVFGLSQEEYHVLKGM